MLSQISKLFLPHRKRRSLCPAISSLRSRQFERLESRSMLSANIGTGPSMVSDYGFDKDGFGEPSYRDDGVYAPMPQPATFDGFMPRGDEPRYAHLDAFNPFHPTYNSNIGDGPGAWAPGGKFGPPSANVSMSSAASSSKLAAASAAAPFKIIIFYVSNYEPYFENFAASSPPSQPSIARSTAPPSNSSNLPQLPKNSASSSKPASDVYVPNGVSAAANAAIPSAAQMIARYTDKSSVVSSTAFDAALQSYSPPRLLVANYSAVDRAISAVTGDYTVVSDRSFDDFIELTESSPFQAIDSGTKQLGSPADDVVNSVLEHLQEFELGPLRSFAPDSQAANGAIHNSASDDTPVALALASSALANAEGGMVMLEFNDGQPRDVDFSSIADNNLVTPASHLNLDSAAVGFYQAVEVAGEEAPAVIRTTASVPVQSVKQNRTENRLSTQGQPGTGEKAAVVAGASALIGAAVWCAQRKQSDEEASMAAISTRGR